MRWLRCLPITRGTITLTHTGKIYNERTDGSFTRIGRDADGAALDEPNSVFVKDNHNFYADGVLIYDEYFIQD